MSATVSLDRKLSILTAGKDPHYALGLLTGLLAHPVSIDFVANAEMRSAPSTDAPNVRYLDLRGEQSADASRFSKITRVLRYYGSLIRYAATTDSKIFHVLWFNKFEWFDNTLLILYYRMLGKRVVFTAHNVDTKGRDGRGGVLNRLSLHFLYRTVHHIFVHTPLMKSDLERHFGVKPANVTVIPYGVNNEVPRSSLTKEAARIRLGLARTERVLLFFGNIAPYKGVDLLVDALDRVPGSRLLIAGRVKNAEDQYLKQIDQIIEQRGLASRVVKAIRFIPDEDIELYFKAADVSVLPYRAIYQSGVLFLSYSFGLPVIVSDAGSLAASVEEGRTGFVCRAGDADDLARTIDRFFASELFAGLPHRASEIVEYVNAHHSWDTVAAETYRAYSKVAGWPPAVPASPSERAQVTVGTGSR